jgi:hypothetical protein
LVAVRNRAALLIRDAQVAEHRSLTEVEAPRVDALARFTGDEHVPTRFGPARRMQLPL